MTKEELMHRAIELSENSVRNGGGPFGAVIAKDGIIIAEASNSVTIDKDPTAHAEVNCVRQACFKLKTFSHSARIHGEHERPEEHGAPGHGHSSRLPTSESSL